MTGVDPPPARRLPESRRRAIRTELEVAVSRRSWLDGWRRRRWHWRMRGLGGIVLAVVLAGAGAGIAAATGAFGPSPRPAAVVAPTTTTPPTTTPPTTTPPPATTTTTSPTQPVSVSVPVVVCATTLGIGTPPAPVSLPAAQTLNVPASLAGKVTLYSDDQGRMMLLGPTGWQCQAAYGADGSGGVSVFPPGASAPGGQPFTASGGEAIVGTESSACTSCTLGQACPLFSTAAASYAQLGYNPAGCRTRPTAETVDQLSANVVAFQDPPGVAGDGIPSGGPYPANGVMTFYPGASPPTVSVTGSWLDTCTLPAATQQLCTTALDLFDSDYGSK